MEFETNNRRISGDEIPSGEGVSLLLRYCLRL